MPSKWSSGSKGYKNVNIKTEKSYSLNRSCMDLSGFNNLVEKAFTNNIPLHSDFYLPNFYHSQSLVKCIAGQGPFTDRLIKGDLL